MKKVLIVIVLLSVCGLMGMRLSTQVSAYKILDTSPTAAESDLADADFAISRHSADSDIDLVASAGAGTETYANGVELIFSSNADEDATATLVIYGAADYGPWEKICSLALTVGGATESTGYKWVDIATVTDTHLTTVSVADNDTTGARMAKVTFDVVGYRYLKVIKTVTSTEKIYRTWIRHY